MRTVLLKAVGGARGGAGGDAETVSVGIERRGEGLPARFAVRWGTRALEVTWLPRGGDAGVIILDGRVIHYRVRRRGDDVWVLFGGRVYSFRLDKRTARRAASSEALTAGTELTAPMPGTVLKINVRAGDAFAAHAALVVMESMKMEMSLSAPYDGSVKEVLCRAGQLVEMGAVLARLERNT